MSAPFLWITLPLAAAVLLLIPRDQRLTAIIGSTFSALLAIAAWLLPIDTVYAIGAWAFKIQPTLELLGRRLSLTAADQPLLTLIYGAAALWFATSATLRLARRLVPLGLGITALLVASLAVEPFLYAALLIEMAVLLAVPMLIPPDQVPGRGALRFLTFQTLAMPFLLFSGWLLAGIEANPGDTTLIRQAATLLGLGFTFLLALFPFSTWLLLLAEEVPPYLAAFIFWTFPTAGLLFLAGFIERYTWLRTAAALPAVLTFSGVLMIAAGGILAAFQRHLGRILACAAMLETGVSLLALSLNTITGAGLFFALFLPRFLSLAAWSLALTILQQGTSGLAFRQVKGLARAWPFAVIGATLAPLALAGLPLLAGFPVRQALAEGLARGESGALPWLYLGTAGLSIAIVRTMAVLVMAPEGRNWAPHEEPPQKIFLVLGWALLLLLGLLPQWMTLAMNRLPFLFQNLGR